jgi:hypothetical protein
LGLGVACQAEISGSAGSVAAGAGASSVAGAGGNSSVAASGPDPVARLHKLTASAFANSLRDLLGTDVPVSPVEQDLDRDGFYSVGNSTVAVSPAGVAQYEEAIGVATAYVFGEAARAAAVVACVPTGAGDVECAKSALAKLGRRAFRRPLAEDELSRFVAVFSDIATEAGSALEGMRYAVSALLQSPSFLYRVELGELSAADGNRSKFTGYEMASRLSAVLWNSAPDDALLDSASRDELAAPAGVRAQAERMLAMPASRAAVAGFFDDYYDLEHLRRGIKDAAIFPTWSTSLRDSLEQELQNRLSDMIFTQRGDFLSLYDSRDTFVNNEVARHYGLPEVAVDGWRAATLPADSPRVGLLGSGALLAGYSLPQRTSATERGKFVVESLLCKVVPPPPPTVVINLDETSDPNAPARERLASHRANPACAGCHALMDPVGLALENFDSIGQYRTMDKGQVIDASGDLDGVPFNNAAELAGVLRNHPEAAACLARKLYMHAQGRDLVQVDELAIAELSTTFSNGGRHFDRLLVDLVASEAFRFVEPVRRQ